MNKELINKYKPEFDHWLNGGNILYKHIKRGNRLDFKIKRHSNRK